VNYFLRQPISHLHSCSTRLYPASGTHALALCRLPRPLWRASTLDSRCCSAGPMPYSTARGTDLSDLSPCRNSLGEVDAVVADFLAAEAAVELAVAVGGSCASSALTGGARWPSAATTQPNPPELLPRVVCGRATEPVSFVASDWWSRSGRIFFFPNQHSAISVVSSANPLLRFASSPRRGFDLAL
jgi:hypothetical protein